MGWDGWMDGMGWLSLEGAIYRAPTVLINFLVTGAEPFRGDIISTTQYGLDVTFHQDIVTKTTSEM